MTTSARAWRLDGGFGRGHLALEEREVPDPGPGEARVRMSALSLNYRDHLVVEGQYNPRQPLPLVPLSDAVGVVEAVGPGVRRVKEGDRVCPAFCQGWIDGPPDRERLRTSLGSPGDGVAAEARVFDADGLVRMPAYLSDREAATLPCAAVTAWNALFELGDVHAGEVVLTQGSGGVSMFALQLAHASGARVIATSSRDDKLERLRELGAWRTINYRSDPSWGKVAKGYVEERGGVDHIVEVGGAGTFDESLRAIRPGGTISVIGVLAGAVGPVPLTRILMNAIRVQGVIVGSRGTFERMLGAFEARELRPVLDRSFPFEELPQALEHLASGEHVGKVTIDVG
ncbi:MAG: NAD(P)-dependent alcohol dehydrogenase [Sandaracinaceae bacterium]